MTDRRQRFGRLASLREKQHDVAVAGLRSARHVLEATVHEAKAHEEQARNAAEQQHMAAHAGEHHAWMLACAANEIEQLHAQRLRARCIDLEAAVAAAGVAEAEARRAYRQTERLLQAISAEELAAATIREQKTLDEAALLLKTRLSKHRIALASFS